MKDVKFITTTSDITHPGHQQLIRSLKHFNYDGVVIQHEWKGFGDKALKTCQFLKDNPDIEYFVYSDAWDTFALAPMEEIISKVKDWDCLIWSSEKACYPYAYKANRYPEYPTPWKFLNGGNWAGASRLFIEMVERATPAQDVNDQVYFSDMFLYYNEKGLIKLNYECDLFQTIAFEHEGDFSYADGRLINNLTGQKPVFCHGNGHTPMAHIYDLLK